MRLDWRLCDLAGRTLTRLTSRQDGEIDVLLNDLATATVTVNIAEPAAQQARPMTTLLKASLGPFPDHDPKFVPVFCGLVTIPDYKDDDNTVEIPALDVTTRLASWQWEPPAPPGNPYVFEDLANDLGQIVLDIIAEVDADWRAAGFPYGVGIIPGTVESTIVRDRQYEPGQEAWPAIQDILTVAGAPDVELVPLDRTDGQHVRCDIHARLGRDQRARARFEQGWGRDNCTINYTPDGTGLVTRAIVTGQSEFGSAVPYAVSDQTDAQHALGVYKTSLSRTDLPASELWDVARAYASTYPFPMDTFTIKGRVEGAQADTGAVYGDPPPADPTRTLQNGWWLGDVISAVRQFTPGFKVQLAGRVSAIKLIEDTLGSGEVRAELECTPQPEQYGVS